MMPVSDDGAILLMHEMQYALYNKVSAAEEQIQIKSNTFQKIKIKHFLLSTLILILNYQFT